MWSKIRLDIQLNKKNISERGFKNCLAKCNNKLGKKLLKIRGEKPRWKAPPLRKRDLKRLYPRAGLSRSLFHTSGPMGRVHTLAEGERSLTSAGA